MSAFKSYQGLWGCLGIYLKYQILTKIITTLVVLPVLWLATGALVAHDGQQVVTQANLLYFLLSWRGTLYSLVLLIVLVAGFVLEISGFIIISSRAIQDLPEASYRTVLRLSLARCRNLVGLAFPVAVVYLVLIAPLTGTGLTIAQLTELRVPNFVMSVIKATPAYMLGYLALLTMLAVIGAGLSFTFQFMVLADQRITTAVRNSFGLVTRQWRRYLRLVVDSVVLALIIALGVVAWFAGVFTLVSSFGTQSVQMRILFVGLWLVQQSMAGLGGLLIAPAQAHALTRTFYDCLALDEPLTGTPAAPELLAKQGTTWLDRLLNRRRRLLALWLAVVMIAAIPGGYMADSLLRDRHPIQVIGHRAGGYQAPENSLRGLRHAIAQNAWGVEVDVQRTADGAYILNHDETFSRVAGVRRRAQDMTLAEVKRLDISAARDGSERVPTLEEFLAAAKGHTRVLIELKGATADERMANDVVAILRHAGMERETVVISLDYGLIRYIERISPAVETGYLYFLAIGAVSRLDGDYLILEEGEASDSRLLEISAANKKAIVWTVNDDDAMVRFSGKAVFGLITDDIGQLNTVLRERDSGSDTDLFTRLFLTV